MNSTAAKAIGAIVTTAMVGALAPAAEAAFAFPGKPGKIAYSAELPGENQSSGQTTDGGSDIFTVNPDGTDRRRLTFNGPEPDDDRNPAWSPGGNLISFNADGPWTVPATTPFTCPSSVVSTVAPDGSGRRAIPNTGGGVAPGFLAGGQRLQYSDIAANCLYPQLVTINLDGTGKQLEPPGTPRSYQPNISPDGRRIATTRQVESSNPNPDAPKIYISNRDGTDSEPLTNSGGEFGPVFSPDGSAIAFSRSNSTTTSISSVVVIDLRTRTETTVSDPRVPSYTPDWGAIPVKCDGATASLVGTPAGDTLIGPGSDVITGLQGDDVIDGGPLNDRICGEDGSDRLVGGYNGDDTLVGGRGRDELFGGEDFDKLKGGAGRDRLVGGVGHDRLVGGPGRDLLKGGKGKRDKCVGGPGRDRAIGCEKTKGI